MVSTSSTACFADEDVMLYVDGALSPTRAAEMHAHLVHCPDCQALVSSTMQLMLSGGEKEGTPSRFSGATEGPRYQVSELLGRGAAGWVFRAFDTRLQRPVAIKLLHNAARSLAREAQALAQISHPSVVQVFDVVQRPNGRAFVAMELVEGANLREWIRTENPTTRQRIEAFVQAAEGVAAVHDAGLVHRDLKPSNILMGVDGRARVADLGLSAPLHLPTSERAGTPLYMAPESLWGAPLDARSDQFSFGVALAEVLGVLPFDVQDIAQLKDVYQRRVPPRLPGGDALLRRVGLVIARTLSVAPAERYASMEHVAVALRRALSGRADVHRITNGVILAGLSLFHWALMVMVIVSGIRSRDAARSHSPFGLIGEDGAMEPAGYLVACGGMWCFFLFAPIGCFLAPLTSYGLLFHRGWAWFSLLVYAALALPMCLTTPVAIYMILSVFFLGVRDTARRERS